MGEPLEHGAREDLDEDATGEDPEHQSNDTAGGEDSGSDPESMSVVRQWENYQVCTSYLIHRQAKTLFAEISQRRSVIRLQSGRKLVSMPLWQN